MSKAPPAPASTPKGRSEPNGSGLELFTQLSQSVIIFGGIVLGCFTLVGQLYLLYDIPNAVLAVKPVAIKDMPFDPYTSSYFPLAILFVLVFGAIALAVTCLLFFKYKDKYPKLGKGLKVFSGFILLLTIAGIVWLVWIWKIRDYDSNRLIIIVNSITIQTSDESAGYPGQDADLFFQTLDAEIKNMLSNVSGDDLSLDIWLRKVPNNSGDNANALAHIKENARLRTVLWIDYTDYQSGTDRIRFYDYKNEFKPWSPTFLPMLEPETFRHSGILEGSRDELLNQSIAGIRLQTAIIYYQRNNYRAAWDTLKCVWDKNTKDEKNPELGYLENDSTYLNLLAILLTKWAEHQSTMWIGYLEAAKKQLQEGVTFLEKELDNPYYSLHRLQIYYTLNDIENLEVVVSEGWDDTSSCTGGEIGNNEIRVRAWHKLIAEIWLDFPNLIPQSPDNWLAQLLDCDDSAEAHLLASRIHDDKPSSDLNSARKEAYKALYLSDDNSQSLVQLYWLCQKQGEECKDNLDDIAEQIKDWYAGYYRRVFHFGDWGIFKDNDNILVAGVSNIITATRMSSSTMHIDILHPPNSLVKKDNYYYSVKMICGSGRRDQTEVISLTPANTDTVPNPSFDVPFGDILRAKFADEFVYLDSKAQQIKASCGATIDVRNQSQSDSQLKQINVRVIGRPSLAISGGEEQDYVNVKISIIVSYGSDTPTWIKYTKLPEDDITVRLCAHNADTEETDCQEFPWEDNTNQFDQNFSKQAGWSYSKITAKILYQGETILLEETWTIPK